jgi:hypothetical protein
MEPNFRRLRRFIVFPLADCLFDAVSGGFFMSLTVGQSWRHCKGYANEGFVLMFGGV